MSAFGLVVLGMVFHPVQVCAVVVFGILGKEARDDLAEQLSREQGEQRLQSDLRKGGEGLVGGVFVPLCNVSEVRPESRRLCFSRSRHGDRMS